MRTNQSPTYVSSTPGTWDAEFATARWDRLLGPEEGTRLLAMAHRVGPRESVLDLGCAQAPLYEMLLSTGWAGSYIGVDWSAVALEQARARRPDLDLALEDFVTYTPSQPVDVVVMGDCLYYLNNQESVLNRYRDFLSPRGRILVTVFEPEPTTPTLGRSRILAAQQALLEDQAAEPIETIVKGDRRWTLWHLPASSVAGSTTKADLS